MAQYLFDGLYLDVRSSDASFAPHSASDNFDDITKPFDTADVAFVIDRRRLYFVRSILWQSPEFRTLLYIKYSEVTTKENGSAVQEVPLFDVDFQSFHSFLLVLVPAPHRQNIITEENVEKLLDIAHKYKTYAVIERCACFIQLYWKDKPKKHLRAVELAAQCRMPEVAKVFLPLAVCRPVSEIDASSANLPPDFYAALLHGKLSKVCTTADSNRQYCPCSNKYYRDCACTDNAPQNDAVIARAVNLLGEKPTTI